MGLGIATAGNHVNVLCANQRIVTRDGENLCFDESKDLKNETHKKFSFEPRIGKCTTEKKSLWQRRHNRFWENGT